MFSNDRIRQLAATHYGLSVTDVLTLAGEVDYNYRLATKKGATYTLKISRPGQDAATIRFQSDLLAHLAKKDLPFATPKPVGKIVKLGEGRLMRLLTWIPGRMLGDVNPMTGELRRQWGRIAGHLTVALADFEHRDAPTDFKWNPSQTLEARPLAKYMTTKQAELANYFWDSFEANTLPYLNELPRSINFNDAHQHNLLVGKSGNISGVIDFGDAMYTHTLNELAIACAYAGMDTPDPLGAMAEVASGYAEVTSDRYEPAQLFNLIIARLLITVATAAENLRKEPDNEYLQISAKPAWKLLEQLRALPAAQAYAVFAMLGRGSKPLDDRLEHWLRANPTMVVDFTGRRLVAIDLSVGSLDLGNNENFEDLGKFTRRITRHLEDQKADFGYGGYGETRPIYTTDDFSTEGNYGPRWRTVHVGFDVWGPVDTPIYAPYDGVVYSAGVDPTASGYGNFIILQHQEDGHSFYTLYGHLAANDTQRLRAGTQVQRRDRIASFGTAQDNGGWPPHLHFQIMRDVLGYQGDFPGVAYAAEAEAWKYLCPDPAPMLGLEPVHPPEPNEQELRQQRKERLGYGLSVSYAQPLTILRGARQYLYDATGRRYLDTVNNVAHVGHEHPLVVKAIQRQAAVLNTNSRYLHENIVQFARELTATMPEQLSVVHFVNSGSEANELALRMCEQWSGTRNMLAVEVGYHGNTGRSIDISGYKFDGKGGKGCPPQTKIIPLPDVFRGLHREAVTAGNAYGTYAKDRIAEWTDQGERVGGFIAESILSCGGQVVLPEGYLAEVYQHVHAAGGLCIADEVQVGVGRVGSHFWGFELQGVVPDIVTIGKPLGNGHPLGAVVCTPEVAANFANGMEYFNTFGGNPVSCAVGLAVLETVRKEGLQTHALETGTYLKALLASLAERHPIIGDVRGEGLFLGFELVKTGLAPATAPAKYLKNRMRELGFLMSTDGPDENVLKIKPPMCFERRNADQLVDYLDRVLGEDRMQLR